MAQSFCFLLYTHHKVTDPIFEACLFSLRQQATCEQLVIVGHRPVEHFLAQGCRQLIYSPNEGAPYNYSIYCQMLMCLDITRADIVFTVEHDVLYPADYASECLTNHQPGRVNYANNIYFLNSLGYWTYRPSTFQSTAFGERSVMQEAINRKMSYIGHDYRGAAKEFDLARGPGETHYEFTNRHEVLDIRHKANTTGTGTTDKEQTIYDTLPYWGDARPLAERLQLDFDHGINHSATPKRG